MKLMKDHLCGVYKMKTFLSENPGVLEVFEILGLVQESL